MIGSVHGCVSCPVVVKPWEPESLSHPQHPLPSQSQAQTQAYSLPQRSSSVHPLPPQNIPGDKPCSGSLSPQRHNVCSGRKGHIQPWKAEGKEISSSRSSSPEKTGSAEDFPKKTGSSNGSPKWSGSVFRSQQEFAEQYEKLLGPGNSGVQSATISSQRTGNFLSSIPNDSRNAEYNKGVHQVESCIRECEPSTCSPNLDRTANPPDSNRKTATVSKCLDAERTCPDIERVLPKDANTRSSSPAVPYQPGCSRFGSPPQLRRINLSPIPLPSIQDKSKTHVKSESSQEFPQISHLSSLRSNKGLPSISNPRFEAGRERMTSSPPRPSLSSKRGRKLQILGRKRSEHSQMHNITHDSTIKHKGKKESNVRVHKSRAESGAVPQVLPPKTLLPRTNKSVSQTGDESSTQTNQDAAVFQQTQRAKFSVGSSTPLSRDVPTPQSLESSNWSFGQVTVAPEVDALTTAAAVNDLRKVKSLLAEGVDVNAVNTFGRTAVQVMSLDNTDLAEVLLKAGANPNIQDEGRRAANSTFRTIAHDVAASGNTDMLRCLLRHGADVNLQDRWGNTPLHLAAKGGHLAAVRLLRRGTSLYQANLQGKTPIMLMKDLNNSAVKQWVDLKKSMVSHLQTLCVLAIRKELGPNGLRQWRKHAPSIHLQRQVLLQSQGGRLPQQASASTLLSSGHSTGSRSLTTRGRGNSNGHPLIPGMSVSKQMADFLTLRDLIPCRLSTGENTSLEVHNTSSGQSNDDVSLGAQASSSLASETGSLFETNLSSIDASQSADDISLPSFDHSL